LRAIDKVGHKVGLTIRSSLRSDGRRRRFTVKENPSETFANALDMLNTYARIVELPS
jgi:hypothetical protein